MEDLERRRMFLTTAVLAKIKLIISICSKININNPNKKEVTILQETREIVKMYQKRMFISQRNNSTRLQEKINNNFYKECT